LFVRVLQKDISSDAREVDAMDEQTGPTEEQAGIAEEEQEIAEEAGELETGAETGAPQMTQAQPGERRRDDNTVYVGKKGTMGYVLAVVTQFNNGAGHVTVKARGKLISRAVDVVEIVRHRFMPNAKVDNIAISTEELTSEDGSRTKVSSIEIKIQK
jgi:archaea-specific DNA-binding protein